MREKVGEGLDEAARKTMAAAGGKSFEVQKEQALFDDPGSLLERLASQAKASQPTTASSPVDGNLSDPFDRLNRRSGKAQPLAKPLPPTVPGAKNQYAASRQPSNVKPEDAAKAAQENSVARDAVGKQASSPASKAEPVAAAKPSVESKIEAKEHALSALPANVQQSAKELAALEIKKRDEAKEQAKKDAAAKEEAKAKELKSDISSAISRVSRDLPNVEVKATPEGLLVSLTDDANFGMFEVGSAKPRPELVVTMSKVGEVLQKVAGEIVVRGHTDSRAYKNGAYDNWRLSSARAQMAYYMLIRGGLDKSRVVAIEGRADRDPKIPSDPEAAQNRRIEILIKEDKR
jgi:chemotaxis protein MotB